MDASEISIISVNWNTIELLKKLLLSVVQQQDEVCLDVTLIDNDSGDRQEFLELAAAYPAFRFIANTENSGSNAINDYLRVSGRYVLFCGPDVELKPGAIRALADFLDDHPGCGAATAMLLNPDGSLQAYYNRMLTPRMAFFVHTELGKKLDRIFLQGRERSRFMYEDLDLATAAQTGTAIEVEQPPFACIMARSSIAADPRRGGVFDRSFPFYYNDVDFCKTVYDAGMKIYLVPAARAVHKESASFKKRESNWKKAESTASLLDYLWKHFPRAASLLNAYFLLELRWLHFTNSLGARLTGSNHMKNRSVRIGGILGRIREKRLQPKPLLRNT